jgi:hypothetical protein
VTRFLAGFDRVIGIVPSREGCNRKQKLANDFPIAEQKLP